MTFRFPDKPISELAYSGLDDLPETYIAELKLDGWRTIIARPASGLTFTSRHKKPIPISCKLSAEVGDVLAALPFGTVLDAEWLARRPGYRSEALWIFDLLQLGDAPLYGKTTAERLTILENVVPAEWLAPTACRGYADFFDAMQDRADAEGIVLKRRDARYIGSYRSSALNPGWLKTKWRGGEAGITDLRTRQLSAM